jgi:hypothetical protein
MRSDKEPTKQSVEGSLVSIPVGDYVGFAKVLYASAYFADVILIKLFKKKIGKTQNISPADFQGSFALYYTSVEPLRRGRWGIVDIEKVSEAERLLSKRVSGGEVWLEDQHLGPASDEELKQLPKMFTFGFKLIEKYADQMAASP